MKCAYKECGKEFTPKTHNMKYCSDECCRIATNENVGMTQEAVEAIHWARAKIQEAAKLKELAKQHPGVADAMQELRRASEQLEIMVKLVDKDIV